MAKSASVTLLPQVVATVVSIVYVDISGPGTVRKLLPKYTSHRQIEEALRRHRTVDETTSSQDSKLIQKFTTPARHKIEIRKGDVLVMLHIQKSAGSFFGEYLMRNLDVEFPCKMSRAVKPLGSKCMTHVGTPWLYAR